MCVCVCVCVKILVVCKIILHEIILLRLQNVTVVGHTGGHTGVA